jgi:hypothetical protein
LLRKGGLVLRSPRPMPCARSFLLFPSDGPPIATLMATVEEILEVPNLPALAPYRRLIPLPDGEIERRFAHPSSKGAWIWRLIAAPLTVPQSIDTDRLSAGVMRLRHPVEVELARAPRGAAPGPLPPAADHS